jgi:hypothetical protein
MINILIILLTQYFQGKKTDLLIKISSFNQGVYGLIFFYKISPSMNEMDEKKIL